MAKKLTKSQLTSKKREDVLAMLTEYLADLGEDVMREGGNSLVFPSTDDEGNELFVKIAVSIPRGDRSGEAYDGYAAAEDYKIHLEEVAANKAQRERKTPPKPPRQRNGAKPRRRRRKPKPQSARSSSPRRKRRGSNAPSFCQNLIRCLTSKIKLDKFQFLV